MLFPSLSKERGKAACGLRGELIINTATAYAVKYGF
jgi:hypothetical protein